MLFNSLSHWDQIDQTDLSRLPCLPHETLLLFHWGSESVRGEMRPALWSVKTTPWGLALWIVETTPWGAYFTGTKQTKETKKTR